MTIMKLREAAVLAEELTSGETFYVILFLEPGGIVAKAIDRRNSVSEQRIHSYIVSWEQLISSNANPLLPAIKVVCEQFRSETPNAAR